MNWYWFYYSPWFYTYIEGFGYGYAAYPMTGATSYFHWRGPVPEAKP
jgi:hypothetical protein